MAKKLLALMVMLLMFSFVACSDDDEDAKADRENAENALKELDQVFVGMTTQSTMFAGISQMPEGLVDIPIGPLMPPQTNINSLSKKSFGNYAIQVDSSFINLLNALEQLYGTHTYNGQEWESTGSPSDEVIIIYPFIDFNDNSQHTMQIRLYDVTVANTAAEINLEIKVDNSTQLTAQLQLLGTNFLNPNAETTITSASVSGTVKDDSGNSFNYSVSITNTQLQFSFGAAGSSSITITVSGQGFFDSVTQDQDPVINEISLKYSGVELVITNTEIAGDGDLGDLYYNGNKIADLVVVDGELYLEFDGGDRVALSELAPNIYGFAGELP